MFAKVAQFFTVATLAASVLAGPLALKPSAELTTRSFHSFNNYCDNFDNFFGSDNFDGSRFSQTVVTEQQTEVVCHTQAIEIIQQRLLVLQEMAKRIITEQICEVETQTVVFSQFHASVSHFSDDLRRLSGRHVGYDRGIASHFSDIVVDNSLSVNDFGFTGHDLGSQTVVVGGNNWDDSRSFRSVNDAFLASRGAVVAFH